jgi:hypothetical protein
MPEMKTLNGYEIVDAYAREAIALLSYKTISITNFTVKDPTREIGSGAQSVTLSWTINKTPTSLTLDGVNIPATSTSKVVDGLQLNTGKTWTLVAKDEKGATSKKTASLEFVNGVYYGVSAKTTVDNNLIRSLHKVLKDKKVTSFSVNAGASQYIYYCVPKRLGTCSFMVGGFSGGFTLVGTFPYTNIFNYTEDYYVYRSDNTGLGSTVVAVS